MRVGVIGYGSMGRRHAKNARDLGHEVIVMDVSPEQQFDAATDGFRTLWDGTFDAVVVATPASSHRAVLVDVFAMNVPTLVEKPVLLTSDEATALPSVKAGRVFVGYNWRFHPLVDMLQERLSESSLRDVKTKALFWVSSDMTAWFGSGYADALIECSHEIDLAAYFCGPIEGVREAVRANEGTAWNVALAHAGGCKSRVLITGRGRPARGVRLENADFVGGYDVPFDDPRAADATEASYQDELAAFLMAAAGGAVDERLCSYDDGLAIVRACDTARMLAGGADVPVEEWSFA